MAWSWGADAPEPAPSTGQCCHGVSLLVECEACNSDQDNIDTPDMRGE